MCKHFFFFCEFELFADFDGLLYNYCLAQKANALQKETNSFLQLSLVLHENSTLYMSKNLKTHGVYSYL